jgi:hypothetical protein
MGRVRTSLSGMEAFEPGRFLGRSDWQKSSAMT